MKPDPNGLPSTTTWKVLGRAPGLTWLALEPVTGRTHQLRVHCAAKDWPIVGERMFQFWDLAATNIKAAATKVMPHLRPIGGTLLHVAAGAGAGTLKFLAAVVIAGFLFVPGPALVRGLV